MTNVLHSVNQAVLAKFDDLTNASILSHDLFAFSELKEPKPVEWPIFETDSERLLAAIKAAGYSLVKLAISLQNDSVVLHGSSEALLYDLIKLQTKQSYYGGVDKFDILLSCIGVLTLIIIGLVILLTRTRKRVEHLSSFH